jgi:hypothetical protein
MLKQTADLPSASQIDRAPLLETILRLCSSRHRPPFGPIRRC